VLAAAAAAAAAAALQCWRSSCGHRKQMNRRRRIRFDNFQQHASCRGVCLLPRRHNRALQTKTRIRAAVVFDGAIACTCSTRSASAWDMTLMSLPLMPVTTSPAATPAAAAALEGSTAATRMPPTARVNKLGAPGCRINTCAQLQLSGSGRYAPQTSSAKRAALKPRLPEEGATAIATMHAAEACGRCDEGDAVAASVA
jgi:hypothetical protein